MAFHDVVKRFGSVTAVDGLTLEIADGELVVLVGPSGCGKTTVLRVLAGLEAVTAGRIEIGGREVQGLPPRQRDVAMVFQDYALYPQMTVYRNLAFGLESRRVPRAQVREQVEEAARRLGLDGLLDRKPRELSGGQRQRVALGRALVRKPQAFLMDEPLSNLDARLRVDMRAEISALQRETGVTTVFVTHDQVEAMTMGDRVAVMRDGVLEQVGAPGHVYGEPANVFVAGFIGSPAMSFGEFAAESQGDRFRLRHGPVELDVAASRLPDAVTVGVRPEHVRPWRPDAGMAGPFDGVVESVEALGRETFVGVRAADDLHVTVRLEGTTRHELGERLRFGIERGAAHAFDARTGAAIAHAI
ncbi:MAG TPA: ABC transporter ATP-binding protein [Gaiellales bacterium]